MSSSTTIIAVASTSALLYLHWKELPEWMKLPGTTTMIAAASTSALFYLQWKNLPEWMKPVNSGRKGTAQQQQQGSNNNSTIDSEDANDDLASLPAVMDKLSEMMSLLKKKTGSDSSASVDLTSYDLMAACYSLLHLYKEIFAKDPDYRDRQYDDVRKNDDVTLAEVRELAEYLEYAHWAYLPSYAALTMKCKTAGLDLILQDTVTEPGRVAHYVACKHAEKLVIIGLKGTNTFSDLLTDLIAIPKEHTGCYFDDKTFAAPRAGFAQALSSEGPSMFCHEGMFTAAIWMADRLQPMIENLFVPLNYKVVICGHSLGAGTACLLGLELRSRIAAFRKNYTDLRVLAFATPPVVSYKASKACAPFVTSMVNNADVITRCSVANLVVMEKLVAKVHEKLVAKGLRLDSLEACKKYYDEHAVVDENLLLSEEELDAFFEETHVILDDEKEALFVPGRIVVMWNKGENDNNEMGGIVTDCGMKMLRQIELSSTMVTDHLVKIGYRPNLHRLLAKLEDGDYATPWLNKGKK